MQTHPDSMAGQSQIVNGALTPQDNAFSENTERIGRIELPLRPWQGRVLPLNYIRIVITSTHCVSMMTTV